MKVESMVLVNDFDHLDNQGNPNKCHRLDGEGFSIYTTDKHVADIDYPSRVILSAKAHDVRRLFENPLMGTIVGLFDSAGAGFNENAEFTVTNATIIYAE